MYMYWGETHTEVLNKFTVTGFKGEGCVLNQKRNPRKQS